MRAALSNRLYEQPRTSPFSLGFSLVKRSAQRKILGKWWYATLFLHHVALRRNDERPCARALWHGIWQGKRNAFGSRVRELAESSRRQVTANGEFRPLRRLQEQ